MKTVIDKIIDELTKERGYCQKVPAMAIDRAIKIVEDHREEFKESIILAYKKAYKEGRSDEYVGLPNVDLAEYYYKDLTDESMG